MNERLFQEREAYFPYFAVLSHQTGGHGSIYPIGYNNDRLSSTSCRYSCDDHFTALQQML